MSVGKKDCTFFGMDFYKMFAVVEKIKFVPRSRLGEHPYGHYVQFHRNTPDKLL